MKFFVFLGILAFSLTQTVLAESSTIRIRGTAQFWERTCSHDGQCSSPVAMGAAQPIIQDLDRPQHSIDAIGTNFVRTSVAHDEYQAKFGFFVNQTGELYTSYISSQLSFYRSGDAVPLTECSYFTEYHKEVFFPNGACSARITEGSVTKLIGVTTQIDLNALNP